jgi:nicotinamide riboside kinase
MIYCDVGVVVKVGLTGSHGTGKTTLLLELKKELPRCNLVSEAARDCPFPLNEKTNFRSQEFIFRTQVQRELDVPLDDITISDRTVYDQLAYIRYAYESGNITYDEYMVLEQYINHWGHTYDYIFYIPIEFEMECDGVRSPDEHYRKAIDQHIKDILNEHVDTLYRCEVRGTPQQRAALVKNVILEMVSRGII